MATRCPAAWRGGSAAFEIGATLTVNAGGMPMQLSVPQGGGYQVTLDAYPASNAPASSGRVYVGDFGNGKIRRIAP